MASSVKTKRPFNRRPPTAVSMSAEKPSLKTDHIARPDVQRIAQKAFELYEQRGMRDGHALDDWLEAEAIVMGDIHETRNEQMRIEQEPTPAIAPGLQGLLTRLDTVSRHPMFQAQRERAIGLALRSYADESGRLRWMPLTEETDLALLYLFADYFPDDGQLSLIEQIRDTIDVHVPKEERMWLDPLKHSSMDLLEIVDIETSGEDGLVLRSLGDRQTFRVPVHTVGRPVRPGQALLSRLIVSDHTILPGTAIVLSAAHAAEILEAAHQWQREREAESGSFVLGEWREFAKRFGYVLLWSFAQARLSAILAADAAIQYRRSDGQPFLYALALYEHTEFRRLADGMAAISNARPAKGQSAGDARIWVVDEPGGVEAPLAVARLTLTATQLTVECDSADRLDTLKHQLASQFGFSLHFRGETASVPMHDVPTVSLEEDEAPEITMAISPAEESRLLSTFLEAMYLEWADRPSPSLDNLTPRHAAAMPAYRDRVQRLIDHMERDDLGYHRTGRRGYDYNILRAHVGVPETTV